MEIKVNQTDLGIVSGVVNCSFMVKIAPKEQLKNISAVCRYNGNVVVIGSFLATTAPQLIQINRERLCVINKNEEISGQYSIIITATNTSDQTTDKTIVFQYQDSDVPPQFISGGIIRYQNYTPKVGEVVVVDSNEDAAVVIDLDEKTKTETFNFKLPSGNAASSKNGKDGISPTIDVETTSDGCKIKITDVNGTKVIPLNLIPKMYTPVVGTVSTLPTGSKPTVSINLDSSKLTAAFNFGIPQGSSESSIPVDIQYADTQELLDYYNQLKAEVKS